eukprot:TRINITY_DN3630_c0_g3_i1.p1 TRINITY_DN3630_c0_g3~~TRINITY_DN3630_c0_g3_i1.p1  ORF type:complete len:484 (+),score=89.52 TRINITY_DN3630_c0_g3_i1:83-1534(+)
MGSKEGGKGCGLPRGSGSPLAAVRHETVLPLLARRLVEDERRRRRTCAPVIAEEDATCRFCWDSGPGLIAPCKCAGSVRWVHRQCLDYHRRTAGDASGCNCCGFRYIVASNSTATALSVRCTALLDELRRWAAVPACFLLSGVALSRVWEWTLPRARRLLGSCRMLPQHEWARVLRLSAALGVPNQAWPAHLRQHRRRVACFAALHAYWSVAISYTAMVVADWAVYRLCMSLLNADPENDTDFPLIREYYLSQIIPEVQWVHCFRTASVLAGPGPVANVLRVVGTEYGLRMLPPEVALAAQRVREDKDRRLAAEHNAGPFARAMAWAAAIGDEVRRCFVTGAAFTVVLTFASFGRHAASSLVPQSSRPMLHVVATAAAHAASYFAAAKVVADALGPRVEDLPFSGLLKMSGDPHTCVRHAVMQALWSDLKDWVNDCLPPSARYAMRALPDDVETFLAAVEQSWNRARNRCAVQLRVRPLAVAA